MASPEAGPSTRQLAGPRTTSLEPKLSAMLDVNPSTPGFTCVGHSSSNDGRCKRQIRNRNKDAALSILSTADSKLGHSDDLQEILTRLAACVLCSGYHRDQAPTFAAQWTRQVAAFRDSVVNNSVAVERASALRALPSAQNNPSRHAEIDPVLMNQATQPRPSQIQHKEETSSSTRRPTHTHSQLPDRSLPRSAQAQPTPMIVSSELLTYHNGVNRVSVPFYSVPGISISQGESSTSNVSSREVPRFRRVTGEDSVPGISISRGESSTRNVSSREIPRFRRVTGEEPRVTRNEEISGSPDAPDYVRRRLDRLLSTPSSYVQLAQAQARVAHRAENYRSQMASRAPTPGPSSAAQSSSRPSVPGFGAIGGHENAPNTTPEVPVAPPEGLTPGMTIIAAVAHHRPSFPTLSPFPNLESLVAKENTPPRKPPTQRPITGDCSICYEPLATQPPTWDGEKNKPGLEIVWCHARCGTNFHKICCDSWKSTCLKRFSCPNW
ncbi:hypothetical protein FQN54_002716 [Arachnomyces sp. PD_36]|nr:hypothetical protein FQN54_002716 [Arachnomyces sp. PD_36]